MKRRGPTMKRAGGAKRRRFNISGRRMARRGLGLKPHTVTRTYYGGNWTPSTVATGNFWQYFGSDINSFPDISSYRAIFDEYKIHSIKYTLRPRYSGFDGSNTTDTTLPGVTNQGSNEVHVIIDPKSILTPSGAYTTGTLNSFLQQGKVRSYRGHRVINVSIKFPCVRDDVNGTVNSKAVRAGWMDIERAHTHYGAHIFITDANLTGNFGQSYDIFTTMRVSFKGSR